MPSRICPIKPDEVVKKKKNNFPSAVLKSFNEVIAKNFFGSSSTFTQKEVVTLMIKKGLSEEEIYNNNWLDVEDIYRAEGWKVEYDKPGYNESYEPKFTFKVCR